MHYDQRRYVLNSGKHKLSKQQPSTNQSCVSRNINEIKKEQKKANRINLFTCNNYKKTTDKLVQMSLSHMNLILQYHFNFQPFRFPCNTTQLGQKAQSQYSG